MNKLAAGKRILKGWTASILPIVPWPNALTNSLTLSHRPHSCKEAPVLASIVTALQHAEFPRVLKTLVAPFSVDKWFPHAIHQTRREEAFSSRH